MSPAILTFVLLRGSTNAFNGFGNGPDGNLNWWISPTICDTAIVETVLPSAGRWWMEMATDLNFGIRPWPDGGGGGIGMNPVRISQVVTNPGPGAMTNRWVLPVPHLDQLYLRQVGALQSIPTGRKQLP